MTQPRSFANLHRPGRSARTKMRSLERNKRDVAPRARCAIFARIGMVTDFTACSCNYGFFSHQIFSTVAGAAPCKEGVVANKPHLLKTGSLSTLDTVNSLYEEPFSSCRQGGGSLPPAATGCPSPTRAVSKQQLHVVLSLVRRTGRRSSVPLASRPSIDLGNSQRMWPEAFPDGLLSRAERSVTLMSPEAMHMRQVPPYSDICCRFCIDCPWLEHLCLSQTY